MFKYLYSVFAIGAIVSNSILAAPTTFPTSYLFQSGGGAPLHTLSIPLSYISIDQAQSVIKSLYPSVQVAGIPLKSSVIVRGNRQDIDGAKKALLQADYPSPQVRLEVQVVEVNTSAQQDYRQLLSALNQEFLINYDISEGRVTEWPKIQSLIRQMEERGDAKIMAKPQIITMSNRQAHIQIGDKIPYPSIEIQDAQVLYRIDYADTGIFLALTPVVHSPQEVSVDLMARMNSVKEYREVGQNRVPVLSTREAQSYVRLKHGETLVLAGLLNSVEIESKSGLPLAMDLPLIGNLFQDRNIEKRNSDIIFLIKPQITPL